MSNRRDIQFTYNPHNKATVLDCSFIVDHSNGNGLGIRSLKPSGRISSVFMNTSATPAAGNPNPAAGVIVVNLQDNYNRYLGGYSGFVSALSGSAISSGLSVGSPYVIVSLGSSTLAQWQAAGLNANIVPAVGASFIAAATSVAGGGSVEAPASAGSGIDHIEVLGDANQMNSNGAAVQGAGQGMQLILLCYKNGVLTAPADGTVIGLNFYLNNSAQGV
jgi:hypothetical protein